MELKKIKDTMDKNDLFLVICAEYLNKHERLVTSELIEEITGGNKELDETAFAHFLSSAFIENDELADEMLREYFIPSIKKLNAEEYRKNPYFQCVKINDQGHGAWTLSHQKYAPYEGFVRDDFILPNDYREVCSIGFFDEEFSFPTIFENGVEWMAIKPNEIETMKEPINKARGNVITFGLGMGYFAYMASIKPEVKSVTIVERSAEVIALFKSHILPYFECKEKIKIIQADAFEYVEKQMRSSDYDYAFVDLWRDTSDGVDLYIKMKKLEDKHPAVRFEYWIERSILLAIRKKLFYALIEKKSEDSIEKILSLDYLKNFVKFI